MDAVSDGSATIIGGIMEHIEEAGIHSGDSACVLPPHTLSAEMIAEISRSTRAMAAELGVIGLMNVQYAVKDDELYVLEVNPRASRTVPFREQGHWPPPGQDRHQGNDGHEPG